jgi:hypothetical protein
MSRNPNPEPPSRRPVPPRRAPIPIANIPVARAPDMSSSADQPAPVAPSPSSYEPAIVARAGTYYRATRYILVVILIACGGWFCYDGWHGYPAENAKFDEIDHELKQLESQQPAKPSESDQKREREKFLSDEIRKYTHRSDLDIKIQKVLGIALPIGGLLMLLWTLRNSRGVYRFSGQTLEVPGHPPIPLEKIIQLDQTLWERKGIAFVEYQTGGVHGRIRLDDFVYQRDPTDAIFEKIEQYLANREQV